MASGLLERAPIDLAGGITPPLLLIVDDDPASVHQLYEVARGLGQVRYALNGEDALRMIRDTRPDLVLLDMELPGISGEDTCRALRRHLEPSELPIICMTEFGDAEREARALEIGANDFLVKPFNPPVARARMETHLALKRRTDQLLHLTHTDALTGLANRRLFDLSLERECRRALRNALALCVMMVDVDHFKAYNDSLGHPQGDICLHKVGLAIERVAQRAGDVVARYGGEEFTVLLPHTDLRHGLSCAEKIHAAVSACAVPHPGLETGAQLTVSIGLSAYHPRPGLPAPQASAYAAPLAGVSADSCSPLELMTQADRALYRAKAGGRNQTQFQIVGELGG